MEMESVTKIKKVKVKAQSLEAEMLEISGFDGFIISAGKRKYEKKEGGGSFWYGTSGELPGKADYYSMCMITVSSDGKTVVGFMEYFKDGKHVIYHLTPLDDEGNEHLLLERTYPAGIM
jgi:hypothetical protein